MSVCRSCIIWICCISGLYKSISCQKLPRIAGGQNANIKDFPFMAALIYKRNDKHFCGGSIISKVHILTAAHCFEECRGGEEKHKLESNEIYVRVGSTEWNHGGIIYDADGLFRHPKYDSFGRKDIGILKIKGELSFSDTVKAIPIAPKSNVPSKGEVTLAGWGRIHINITASHEILQKTEHEIISHNECDKYYEDLKRSNICTSHKGKTSGACAGDSGGPVIYKGQIIGIMIGIYDDDCYTLSGPNVHTKVISYKKWIDTYLKGS